MWRGIETANGPNDWRGEWETERTKESEGDNTKERDRGRERGKQLKEKKRKIPFFSSSKIMKMPRLLIYIVETTDCVASYSCRHQMIVNLFFAICRWKIFLLYWNRSCMLNRKVVSRSIFGINFKYGWNFSLKSSLNVSIAMFNFIGACNPSPVLIAFTYNKYRTPENIDWFI